MKKIGFICTGNSCRSPMAECYFKSIIDKNIEINVFSAGTACANGWNASKEAIEIMDRLNLDLRPHKSTPLSKEMVETTDMLIVMTNMHKEAIISRWPEASKKIYLLREFEENSNINDQEIMDPVGFPVEIYEKCFDLMKEPIKNLGKIICKK